uniref:Uncharacterized protein n=1 Tax=Zea mays TaxID=4577 RepID=B4FHZ5_MAIZE|nr:unknown [Zea mays]
MSGGNAWSPLPSHGFDDDSCLLFFILLVSSDRGLIDLRIPQIRLRRHGEPRRRACGEDQQRRRQQQQGFGQLRVQHLSGPGAGSRGHPLRPPLLLAMPLRVAPRARALPGVSRLQGRRRGGEARPSLRPWWQLHLTPCKVGGRCGNPEQADRAAALHCPAARPQ